MTEILTLNKIAKIGLDRFGDGYVCGEDVKNPAGILVRSASMHDMEFSEGLLAIARAGAGVNNIPVDKCAEQGIVVFNTPGANANAVKELVIAGLLLASRKVAPAIEWAKTLKGKGDEVGKLVEKGKNQFVGPEIKGKKLGVIGLGAIGVLVANAGVNLGMDVYGYDPFISVDVAWGLSSRIHRATNLKEIFEECDYISVHVPQTADTKGMINAEAIASMKDNVRILNFSRDALVNTADMIEALNSGKVAAYVVDFPTDDILGVDGVVAIPHLGASTPESEDNCAVMAVNQMKDYIENGNIRNSVNFPPIDAGVRNGTRICIIHENKPNMLTRFSGAISATGVNIENMLSKSKGDFAYTLIDCGNASDEAIASISEIEGVIRFRILA